MKPTKLSLFLCSVFLFVLALASCNLLDRPSADDVETSDVQTATGTLPGTLTVDQYGAAAYSISLNVAPGITGLTPNLVLSYNSQSGAGLFGQGWSLSDLSAITRCSVTRDGVSYPVEYDADDRFCIDGKLLIPVSGDYGGDGTLYHTEKESWIQFQAYNTDDGDSCGSGPCYFVATLKQGKQLQYGNTADSRIEAVPGENVTAIPQGSVRVWTVNRQFDLNQNYIDYTYQEDATTGEYTPQTIVYGGNLSSGSMPQRVVEFTASDVTPVTRYQGGAIVVHSKAIESIQACLATVSITTCQDSSPAGFASVATYSLQIAFNDLSQLNYLDSIQTTGADGSVLPPTTFTYSAAASGPIEFQPAANWTGFFSEWTNSCQARTMGDVNGDGRLDMIGFGASYTEFALSGGLPIADPPIMCLAGEQYDPDSGCSAPASAYFSCAAGFDSQNNPRAMADVNGDGLFDIVGFGASNIHVALSRGTAFATQTNWADYLVSGAAGGAWSQTDVRTLADINGDGLSDVIGFGGTTTQFGISNGSSFDKGPVLSQFFSTDQGFSIANGNPPMLGDVNGDSLTDVVGIKMDGGKRKAYVGLSQGNTFAGKVTWNDDLSISGQPASLQQGRNPIYLLDLNADQLADLVFFGDEAVYVSFSTGTSFGAPQIWNSTDFTYDNGGWDDSGNQNGTLRTFADINGDGRQDLIGFGATEVHFGMNTGSAFVEDATLFAPVTSGFIYKDMGYLQENPRFPVDMTGDGISDLLGIGDVDTIIAAAPASPALLTSVVDGIGKTIELCYQSISAADSDVVGVCSSDDTSNPVYEVLADSEFNADDMTWCSGRCREYNTPLFVVKSRTVKAGAADPTGYRYEYSYAGALVDRLGYGFLGFRRSIETDLQVNATAAEPGVQHISNFRQAFPFDGELDTMQMVQVQGSTLMGQTNYVYDTASPTAGRNTYLVQISSQTTQNFSLASANSYTVGKTVEYDDYGNVSLLGDLGNVDDPSDDLYTKTTFDNDSSSWVLGYPTESFTCPTSACDQILAHEQMDYDDQRNLVYRRSYDDVNDVWLGIEYTQYDAYGNALAMNNAWWDANMVEQEAYNDVTVVYESVFNTYPQSRTNAAGQVSSNTFDARFGAVQLTADVNANEVTINYDGFGRMAFIYGPDADGTKTLLQQTEYGTSNGEMYKKVTSAIDWNGGTREEINFFDALDRNYRVESDATSGTIVQLTCYQSETQIQQFSNPYYKVNEGDTCASNSAEYWTAYVYDSLQRPQTITHPDLSVTNVSYDISEYEGIYRDYVQRTDSSGLPEARTISSYLNPDNLVLKRIFPLQAGVTDEQAATHTYDPLGRTLMTTAPGGATTAFVYDSLGRTTSTDNSDSGTTSFSYYKENGLAESIVDATGTTHNFTQYDSLLRLQTEEYVSNGNTRTIQYSYDESATNCFNIGRLTSVSDSDGLTHSYCYDAGGNNTVSSLGVDGKNFDIASVFDPLARVTTFTFPDSSTMQRSYNLEGPLNDVQLCDQNGDNCESYASWSNFSATGHPALMTYLNGVATNNTYDLATGLIQTVDAAVSGDSPLLDKTYSWNTLGLLTGAADNIDADYSMTFTPDGAGSLQQATIGQGGGAQVFNYAYNVAGALTQKGETTFTGYSGQKLTTSVTNSVTTNYDYYANGALKTKTVGDGEEWSYSYNGQNLLASVSKTESGNSTTEATYVYDYQGSLIKRIDGEGVTSYYISGAYDITVDASGDSAVYTKNVGGLAGTVAVVSVAGEFESQTLAHVRQGSDESFHLALLAPTPILSLLGILYCCCAVYLRRHPTRLTRKRRHYALVTPALLICVVFQSVTPNVMAADALSGNGYPVAGNTLFFHADPTGGTTFVTDSSGMESTRLTYLPFGDLYEQLSSGTDDFRAKYAGKELIQDTGLYYFGARFYDPDIGQFIQGDSLVVGGPEVNASSFNRFAYAGNNPVSYTDPSGHSFGSFMKDLGISLVIGLAVLLIPGLGSLGIFASMGAVGAYWGGESANHQLNPFKWDWKSGKTYAGLAAGFAVSEAGLGLAVVAPEALPEEAGAMATLLAGVGTSAIDGFAQNATFAALGGANTRQIMLAGLEGAAIGVGFSVAAEGVGAVGSRLFKSAAQDGTEMTKLGRDSAGEGAASAGEACSLPMSFAAGTPVHTRDGTKPIEAIRLGDQVLAYEEASGISGYFTVTALFTRTAHGSLQILAGGEQVETTPEHPFYVEARGWVEAKDLQVGDRLLTQAGTSVAIEGLDVSGRDLTVYNFEVAQAHNYYVSDEGVLTHNPCWGNSSTSYKAASGKKYADFEDFWDNASQKDFDHEWSINENGIKAALRGSGGGDHEWMMVSQAPQIRSWGVDLATFRKFQEPTLGVRFENTGTGQIGVHTGSSVSSYAHITLSEIIDNSSSLAKFKTNLANWANGKTDYLYEPQQSVFYNGKGVWQNPK